MNRTPVLYSETMNPEEKQVNPLWETLAMIGAFALLWVWFLVRQSAIQKAAQQGIAASQVHTSPLWTLAQIAAAAILFIVFLRRLQRARAAMREAATPRFPPGFDAYSSMQDKSKNKKKPQK
ncbi:MAG TPA: hypothetical protein VF681_02605 [Abditibacteriaceae bacterium]|jgi:hypothetical protein